MSNRWLSEMLGEAGAYDCLQVIERRGPGAMRPEVVEALAGAGSTRPDEMIDLLQSLGCLTQDSIGRIGLSQAGRVYRLLLAGLNGLPLDQVVRGLSHDSNVLPNYYLLTNNMTEHFVNSLYERPDFASVYICSPWLAFDTRTLDYLISALALASRVSSPKLFVLTRRRQSPKGIEAMQKLGADLCFREDLHAKLYIRDPGPNGGLLLAIVGSQNLTRSNYAELGIAVRNDAVIHSKLLAYFFMVQSTII